MNKFTYVTTAIFIFFSGLLHKNSPIYSFIFFYFRKTYRYLNVTTNAQSSINGLFSNASKSIFFFSFKI